jgi:hypothetical protein
MEADLRRFIDDWLPAYVRDNRSYLTVGIGCTGGQHRSVYLAEKLAAHFRDVGAGAGAASQPDRMKSGCPRACANCSRRRCGTRALARAVEVPATGCCCCFPRRWSPRPIRCCGAVASRIAPSSSVTARWLPSWR